MSNERFTGGDSFTGFKKMVNDVLMKNELAGGRGAYQIQNAKNTASGWSFGPAQWDLGSGNTTGTDAFKDILNKAVDASGTRILTDAQSQTLYNAAVSNSALSTDQISQINLSLSSDYGRTTINNTKSSAFSA